MLRRNLLALCLVSAASASCLGVDDASQNAALQSDSLALVAFPTRPVVRALVLFTPDVEANLGRTIYPRYRTNDPAEHVVKMFDDVQHIFDNSKVDMELELADVQPIDYSDDPRYDDWEAALVSQMMNGDRGLLGEIEALRRDVDADFVALWRGTRAGLPRRSGASEIGAHAGDAYVQITSRSMYPLLFVHEMAHLMGAEHRLGTTHPNKPDVPGVRTMMSVNANNRGKTWIPFFSNPDVLYNGVPTGDAHNDNAAVLNAAAHNFSVFGACREADLDTPSVKIEGFMGYAASIGGGSAVRTIEPLDVSVGDSILVDGSVHYDGAWTVLARYRWGGHWTYRIEAPFVSIRTTGWRSSGGGPDGNIARLFACTN